MPFITNQVARIVVTTVVTSYLGTHLVLDTYRLGKYAQGKFNAWKTKRQLKSGPDKDFGADVQPC